MKFEPHGDIRFFNEGRLLFVEVRGPWNAELVESYHLLSAPLVAALGRMGPWAGLIIPRISTMFTMDAADALRRMLHAGGGREGRVGACYVIAPDVEGYRLCDPLLRDIYDPCGPFEIFETLPPARAWCERLVAEADRGGAGSKSFI
jgi:hypothetical protein